MSAIFLLLCFMNRMIADVRIIVILNMCTIHIKTFPGSVMATLISFFTFLCAFEDFSIPVGISTVEQFGDRLHVLPRISKSTVFPRCTGALFIMSYRRPVRRSKIINHSFSNVSRLLEVGEFLFYTDLFTSIYLTVVVYISITIFFIHYLPHSWPYDRFSIPNYCKFLTTGFKPNLVDIISTSNVHISKTLYFGAFLVTFMHFFSEIRTCVADS